MFRYTRVVGGIGQSSRAITGVESCITSRCFAARRGGEAGDEDLGAARTWLSRFDPDTLPRSICEVSFSRSSGPGGQNVNKVSSKATLRVSTTALLAHVPRLLHPSILSSRFHARKSSDIVIHADESRKQNDNIAACYRKLHELVVSAARDAVPNETRPEQVQRVEALQKAEAAGRRRMKESQSRKKSARRGGRGDD